MTLSSVTSLYLYTTGPCVHGTNCKHHKGTSVSWVMPPTICSMKRYTEGKLAVGVAEADWRDCKSLETWRNMLQKYQNPAAHRLLTRISRHEPWFLNIVVSLNVFYENENFLGPLFIIVHAGLNNGCLPYIYQVATIYPPYCKNSYSIRRRFL